MVVGAAGLGDTGRQGLGELSLTSGALTLDVGGGAARAGDGLDQAGKLGSTSACGSGDKAPCTHSAEQGHGHGPGRQPQYWTA